MSAAEKPARVRRHFAKLAEARAHAALTNGDVLVALPYYLLLALLLSCAFVVGDWLLVYQQIGAVGGSATVYLPSYFVVEALFAIGAAASIIVTFVTVEWDVYENVDVSELSDPVAQLEEMTRR